MAENEAPPPPPRRAPGFPGLPWTGVTDDAAYEGVQEAARRRRFPAATAGPDTMMRTETPLVLRESAKSTDPQPPPETAPIVPRPMAPPSPAVDVRVEANDAARRRFIAESAWQQPFNLARASELYRQPSTDQPEATGPAARVLSIGRNLAAHAVESRAAAQALHQATQHQIADLRDKRSNDPDVVELIDFLEWLATGLSQLAETLDRAIAQPGLDEPMFLGNAAKIAEQLQLGLMEALEKNRVRIFEVGACVGTAVFLNWLGGESLAHFLSIIFGEKK
jgi:hypothetical protein